MFIAEYNVSIWNDEKLLEMDSGNDCTEMQMYLVPLNCTLKMVKPISFMLCIFYHSKKVHKDRIFFKKDDLH